jgi:hypothetical protein
MKATQEQIKLFRDVVDLVNRQIVVDEIDHFATTLQGCYAQLPPKVQAEALQLGHSLAALKIRITAVNE